MVYDFSNEAPALYDKSSGKIDSDARFWIRYFKIGKGWLDVNCCLHTLDNRVICPAGVEPAVLLPGEDVTQIEYVDNYRDFGIDCSKETIERLKSNTQHPPVPLKPSSSAPVLDVPLVDKSAGGTSFVSGDRTRLSESRNLPTEAVLAASRPTALDNVAEQSTTTTYQTQITNLILSTSLTVIAKQSTKRAQLIIINAGNSRVWVNTIPNFTVGTGIPIQSAGGQLKLTKIGGMDICSAQFFAIAEASTNVVVIEVVEVD
jgi:hypothetical protein